MRWRTWATGSAARSAASTVIGIGSRPVRVGQPTTGNLYRLASTLKAMISGPGSHNVFYLST